MKIKWYYLTIYGYFESVVTFGLNKAIKRDHISHKDWPDSFSDNGFLLISGTPGYFERKDNQSYYINRCKFSCLTQRGAIYVLSADDNVKFLVEASIFVGCSSNESGGSISFGYHGQFVQKGNSFIKSDAEWCCVFSIDVTAKTNINSKNELIESVIINNGKSKAYRTLLGLYYGLQKIDLCNISSNKVSTDIGAYDSGEALSNSIIQNCIISTNQQYNAVGYGLCLYAYHYSSTKTKACHFVNNTDNSGEGKLIAASGYYVNHILTECCIFNNKFHETFYAYEGARIKYQNSYADNTMTEGSGIYILYNKQNSECKIFSTDYNDSINYEINNIVKPTKDSVHLNFKIYRRH